jgi:NAD(P)-dependent dehydrogenase (short-subunit alcohol dehydrogenase family)
MRVSLDATCSLLLYSDRYETGTRCRAETPVVGSIVPTVSADSLNPKVCESSDSFNLALRQAMNSNRRTCLITGATEGVGRATAVELARKGFNVVIAARNAVKAKLLIQDIAAATGNEPDYIQVDLRSLKQVQKLVDVFKRRYPKLDVLINNAGIFSPKRTVTEDGFETTYQVNYLAHFQLTHLLLDELKKSEQGRVINLSSSVYGMGKFDLDNLQSEKQFSTMGSYATSKLLLLMFTIELADRLRKTAITANAVHPGIVRTQMMMQAPGMFKMVALLALPFAISPEKGAATSVYLASSEDLQGASGEYFTQSKVTAVKTRFNTKSDREVLWNASMKSLP